jgi:hypothetical protein
MARAEKNPFALEDRTGGPDRGYQSRVWTEEEQAEKLGGYLEVPPEYWAHVRYGTHVRYYTKAEGYRPGGFVLKNPADLAPPGGAEKRTIRLQNGFNDKVRGHQQWAVAYEDMARLFIKSDAATLVILHSLESAVKGLNENIRKLAEHSKRTEARVAALERGQR